MISKVKTDTKLHMTLGRGCKVADKFKFARHGSFVAEFMAWTGVCYNGKTKVRSMTKVLKLNLNITLRVYYINIWNFIANGLWTLTFS